MAPIVLVVLGAGALAALVGFDLAYGYAANDDYLYLWPVGQLVHGHGFRFLPSAAPPALPQVAWGALATLGQPSYRRLHLAALPVILLAAWAVYRTARLIGADRDWSGVAALALAVNPLVMSLTTSFMTDTYFLALEALSILAAVRWLRGGRGLAFLVVVATLGTLQRQFGVAVALALTVAVIVKLVSSGEPRRRYIVGLAILSVTQGLAVALPPILFPSFTGPGIVSALRTPPATIAAATRDTLLFLAPMVGFLCAPFLLALMMSLRRTRWRRRAAVVSVAVAIIGTGLAIAAWAGVGSVFPGDYLTRIGLGPAHVPNIMGGGHSVRVSSLKPPLFPDPMFGALQLLACTAFAALAMVLARRPWKFWGAPSGTASFLISLAGGQAGLIAVRSVQVDRYYLGVALPVLVLAVGAAGRVRIPAARIAAVGVLAVWLGIYVAGEQDYQAWQAARYQAAAIAYGSVSPGRVDAGYEANATLVAVPYYESTGILPFNTAPPNPLRHLEFAAKSDSRPGVSYDSIAPGRIVIVDDGP